MRAFRMLTGLMCVAVLMSGMALTAYAGGGEEYVETAPPTEATEPETVPVETEPVTVEPGIGFLDEGNFVTRDLLYDKATNKQFISVQTNGGATFYIVIDYDKPVDEDADLYETYFFSVVDEADLLAAMEAAGVELPVCSCAERCMVGAINTACEVCATNMTECVGVEPEPEIVETQPATEPEPEKTGGGSTLLILALAAAGGVAAWYFKVYKPKQDAAQPEEDYGEADFDGYADEEDGPPWDEEDNG